jgi:diguanylate cyclase (GGDEF)-like protein
MCNGGWLSTHEDITDRQRSEMRIAHMAHYDALTDLPNRVLFKEKMEEALAGLKHADDGFALFIFDLDLFKAVNDSLGHPIGDALLQAIAVRLRGCTDHRHTIGRLGGDEFAIIQTMDGDQKRGAIGLAETLLQTICAPYEIDGHPIVIGISIGMALAPNNGDDASQLLKNADLALYRAKSGGRNGYRFFEPEMDRAAHLQHALEIDLRNALSRDEFDVHYQLIIDIASQQPCGAEALVRWRHPQLGLLSPDRFIPIAENIGLIVPLGEWILRRACMEAAKWPTTIKLAVNLSPVQFGSPRLVDAVSESLARSGLAPERLELEITESVLLQKDAGNLFMLERLSALGVGIVLDDFGTGYSSLGYLRMYKFSKIKIDKSFVAELPRRDDCAAIVCAVTGLARSLGIGTTAEGVETWEQFELLRAAGCNQAQGFLFSRPGALRELDFSSPRRREEDETAAQPSNLRRKRRLSRSR